jgi:hypothetical protein
MSWIDHLDEFECQRCGNCCKGVGDVLLNREDIRRIAAHLEMTQVDFLHEFTRRTQSRRALIDQRGPKRWCVFYGGDGVGCRINAVKPKQCADYPHRWHNEDTAGTCEGVKALIRRFGEVPDEAEEIPAARGT